jgi:hypothetical protein
MEVASKMMPARIWKTSSHASGGSGPHIKGYLSSKS